MAEDDCVPSKFFSLDELKKFISNKENTEFIQLCIDRSKTIENARQRGIKRYINPQLMYYGLTYRCIHSGSRISRSTGIRPTQWTLRQDCPFKLRLKASADGQFLEVMEFLDIHNHTHNKETYDFLPRQRHMESSPRPVRRKLLIRASKKLIEAQLLSNIKVSLKDPHSLESKNSTEITGNEEYIDDPHTELRVDHTEHSEGYHTEQGDDYHREHGDDYETELRDDDHIYDCRTEQRDDCHTDHIDDSSLDDRQKMKRPLDESESPQKKKIKGLEELISTAWEALQPEQSKKNLPRFEIYGKHVGMSLQEIADNDQGQCVIAEKLIGDILYLARFKQLTVETVVGDSC